MIKLKVNARALRAEVVPIEEANTFVRAHHRQGASASKYKIRAVGLYRADELLAVAQFTTPRTSAKQKLYTTELLRLAFKEDVRIAGGASKLISHYKTKFNPPDIFTYQDASGEVTDVYKHCGFSLISQAKTKEYLVAPGKTLKTGSRKEILGMPYATRFGPDRILGSKLGEIFRKDGTRKANKELFVENLGWHIEETPGDKVWEWFNPDLTFYTYKITATDSAKYYYGMSHVKKDNATMEDCTHDGYFGSGGGNKNNKFNNWKKKHKNKLEKTIISLYSSRAAALHAEITLIGDLYKTDPHCLNSARGGRDGGALSREINGNILPCSIHGLTTHAGASCMKCTAEKRVSYKFCEIHGETKHNGDECFRCYNLRTVRESYCETHGLSKHQGNVCNKCNSQKPFKTALCEIHGESTHIGLECVTCRNEIYITLKPCETHGLTKHLGVSCYKCFSKHSIMEKSCSKHGMVLHRGTSCFKCLAEGRYSVGECPLHGTVTFSGGKCNTCINSKSVNIKDCPVHGSVKHQGDKCSKCSNISLITLKMCAVHGESKHRGNSCYMCITDRKRQVRLNK